MKALNLLIRVLAGAAIFVFFVLQWALRPYLNSDIDLNLTVISVFYGNSPPIGIVRDVLLLSRALAGLALTSYAVLPAAAFFAEFDYRPVNNVVVVVLLMLSIVVFFISLVIQHVYHL